MQTAWRSGQLQGVLARMRPPWEPTEVAQWTLRNLPPLGVLVPHPCICSRCGQHRPADSARLAPEAEFTGSPPPGVETLNGCWVLCRLCYFPVEGLDTVSVNGHEPNDSPNTPMQYRAVQPESEARAEPQVKDAPDSDPGDQELEESEDSDPEGSPFVRQVNSRTREGRSERNPRDTPPADAAQQYPQSLSTPSRAPNTATPGRRSSRGGDPEDPGGDDDPEGGDWRDRSPYRSPFNAGGSRDSYTRRDTVDPLKRFQRRTKSCGT